MRLSIITINLNNRDGLQRTINSVIGQKFADYEWIIIDGGSTDGSRELIEEYADHFSYWCSEPDTGIYNAMNKGIRQAKGEWLQFLNSGDSLYEETTLQKVFERKYSSDVLYGNIRCRYADGGVVDYIGSDNLSYSYLYRGWWIAHPASFFKRELFKDHLYNEHFRIVSDWAYDLDLMLRGCVFEHVNQFVVWYDTNGITSRMMDAGMQEGDAVRNSCPPHLKPDMDWISHFHQVYYNGKLCTALTHFFLSIVAWMSRWRGRVVTWRIKMQNKRG